MKSGVIKPASLVRRVKIRTLLLISSGSLLVFTLTIASVMVLTTARLDAMARQEAAAQKMIKGAFVQDGLVQEYLATHEDRPAAQWHVQLRALNDLLSDPVMASSPSSAYLGRLHGALAEMKAAFDGLSGSGSALSSAALEAQLASDLLIKSQSFIGIADQLISDVSATRGVTRTVLNRTVITLLLLLCVLTSAIAVILYRRIVSSLAALLKGTRLVGEGDLRYHVGNDTDCEIGQLSRAFNQMTAKLRQSYDTLEEKVEARTRELRDLGVKNEILLESIGDAVVAIDTNWNILVWNAMAARISGWTKEEAIGKPFRDIVRFIRENNRSENVLFISDAMLSNQVRSMENHTLLIRKDGTEVPVGDSAAPFTGPDGKVAGAIIVFRDASPERDALLVRSSFAYASHQLRTPVNKALWAIEALRETKKTSEIRKNAEVAHVALLGVRKLTAALIEVSEIDQGMVIPKTESVAVAEILEEAIGQVAEKAKSAGSRVVLGDVIRDAQCVTDKRLVVRMLTEVLENAIEYGQSSDVTLSVVAHDRNLVFSVADKGGGIVPEQQNLVYTKFFRGQNVPEDSIGAGLGLYICKEYAKLLGGRAWFRSEAGKGTTFYLALPCDTPSRFS